MQKLLFLFLVLFTISFSFLLGSNQEAQALTVIWDGGGDGVNWSDASNWSTDLVPTGADDIIIDGNNAASSTVHLNINFAITTGSLTIDADDILIIDSGNTLTNSNTITNAGTITSSGNIRNNAGGTIQNDGTITSSGSTVNTGTITNAGTITSSGPSRNNVGGTITNNAGGTITHNSFSNFFDNFGTITNTGGTINLNPFFRNNSGGTVNNNTGGTINGGGLQNDGTINNNAGGTINGGFTNNFGGTITNSGSIIIPNLNTATNLGGTITNNAGGTITVNAGGTIDNNAGGTIDNFGTIANAGTIRNTNSTIINECGAIYSGNPPLDNPVSFVVCDTDGDGFPSDVDCDDNNNLINPGAFEIPGDTIDQNCDGVDSPLTCGLGTILSGNQCIPDPNAQPIVCGQNTIEISGICVPDLNQICGEGTIISGMQCVAQQISQVVGGVLLDIDTIALFVSAIGTNPVITGLVVITLAGIAWQATSFIYKKKKSNKS